MLYVKKSNLPNAGLGLFTDSPIRKGELIIEYLGEITDWKTCENRAQEGKGGYVFYVNKNYCIDAYEHPEAIARYANDAKGPGAIKRLKNNAEYYVKGKKAYIKATCFIKAGSEVLVTYGDDYWEAMLEGEEEVSY